MKRVLINEDGQHKAVNKEDFDLSLNKLDKGYSLAQLRNLSEKVLLATIHFLCTETGKDGFWDVDETDVTSIDNVGTCIVSVDGVRIKRRIQDKILYSWFDNGLGIDDTETFDRAVNASKEFQKPLILNPYETIIVNKKYQVYQDILGFNSVIKLRDNSTINYSDCILHLKKDNITLSGFKVDGNRINNAGLFDRGIRGLYADRLKYLTLSNVKIHNTRDIGLYITNCPFFTFLDSEVDSCGRYGQEMISAQADRIGCLIDNTVNAGTEYYMGSEMVIDRVVFKNCGLDGLVLGVAGTVQKAKFYNNGIEFSLNDVGAGGLYVRPPQTLQDGIIDGLNILDCFAVGNTGLGIDIGNNFGSLLNPRITNLIIKNSICYDNNLNGIGIASAENVLVSGNTCYNNGKRVLLNSGNANLRRSGILVATVTGIPFKNVIVENNICYDSRDIAQKTQQHGLMLWGNPKLHNSENLVIQNNDFTRNAMKPIQWEYNGPVASTSILNVQNNAGCNSFTYVPPTGDSIPPINPHIYLNPASAVSIVGIGHSVLNNVIILENVSVYDITLVNSATFKMLGNENLVLKQNKPASFILQFETGAFVWKQLPSKSLDVFYNGQIVIQNQGAISYPPSSRFTVNSNYQGSLPIPRMTKASRLAIVLPEIGLQVYQLTGAGIEAEEGNWQYKSTGWVKIS